MTTSTNGDGPRAGVVEAERERVTPPPESTLPAPETTPDAAPEKAPGWGLPLVVLIAGMFMSILDISIVNVAIPVIRQDFGVSAENIQWISTSYSLTEGVVVPVSAWLGVRFGLKRLYIWALLLFTVASVLCGMADGLGAMIFFRIMQAIPGGILPVTCLTLLFRIVPPQKLGAAMGLYGLGIVVAPGVGPTLGGYLVENVDWRLIFYINIPIGVIGAIAAVMVLPKTPGESTRTFDLLGFISIAGAMFSLLLALEKGSTWGWTSYPVLILLAVATNLLAFFVVIELQVKQPLLNIRVLKHWPFVNSLLLISAISVGLFAVLFYIPLFLQSVQRLSPWNTGLVLLPQALTMAVLMPIAGQLYDKFGARWPAVVGLSLTGGGILWLSRINVDISRGELVIGLVAMAAGMALGMMPIMTGGLASLPPEVTDVGSAFNTLTQRVTSALGLAALTAVVTVDKAQFMADRSGLLQSSGANVDQRITQMADQGQSGLIPLWQQLSNQVQTQAYSNAFFIAGSITLVGVLLAFGLKSGPQAQGGDKPMAH
ncbi:DHA2 family efflux MFS transporter permease subunit [Pseudonocardia acaciae]|uniref:DHA2 family efflux MFS transporter permease subunit n=1 Tax=Pseudonocardia acaciae TaxID=551276 RepID=UPI0009FD5C33|nr:DHA2 family efflux MFS transporter permease subunit [Pseudonocardia acaciae]